MPFPRRRAGVLALVSCAAFPALQGAEAACFYPNGRQAVNDSPCRPDALQSTCCGPGYVCLSNGLCQAIGEELRRPGATEFVRGSCTDATWQSFSCPLFCNTPGFDFLDGGNGVFKCKNTTEDLYFCDDSRSSPEISCEQRKNVLSFAGTPSAITTIGATPPATPSPVTTTVPSSTSSTTISPLTSSPSSSSPSERTPSTTQSPPPTSTSPGQTAGTKAAETAASSQSSSSSSSSNLGPIIGGAIGGTAVVVIAVVFGWVLASKRTSGGSNGQPLTEWEEAEFAARGRPIHGGGGGGVGAGGGVGEPREAPGGWKSRVELWQGPQDSSPAASQRGGLGGSPAGYR